MDELKETLEVGALNGHEPRIRLVNERIRLNLGGSDIHIPGFINLDIKTGTDVRKLPYEDGCVDEIHASHILEHFGINEVEAVVKEWARVLKPGGRLRIAVPDVELWAKRLLDGGAPPQVLMGGQTDEHDFHKSAFNAAGLALIMSRAGLTGIQKFNSNIKDCSSLDWSLNLEGFRAYPVNRTIHACISVPSLMHSDTQKCLWEALLPAGIPMHMVTGAFWAQCLERAMATDAEKAEWLLCLDYDVIFPPQVLDRLCTLFEMNPDIDALAPLHPRRGHNTPLFSPEEVKDGAVKMRDGPEDLIPVKWAHFGCTLIRASSLKKMAHPWFHGRPNDAGEWKDGCVDDDISFWNKWRECGNNIYVASRVPLGHTQRVVTWLDEGMEPIYQQLDDYWKRGIPKGVRM